LRLDGVSPHQSPNISNRFNCFSNCTRFYKIALDNGCISEQIFRAQYAQAAKTKALIGGFKQSLLRRNS